jgi:uncharacterized protein YecE (DUF72 family)
LYIGTSGYSYSHWKGSFYPQDIKGEQMLPFYANKFNTVEINSTFYHVPRPSTVKKWLMGVPEGFVFSVKGNRQITHFNRLKNVKDITTQFYEAVAKLEDHLGVVLWQLPPSIKKDIDTLGEFLEIVSVYSFKSELEFRNKSWVDATVFPLLREHNAAFVVSHGDNYPLVTDATTANFVYVRLHGYPQLYKSSYTDEQLASLATRLKIWLSEGKSVFVYFNNDAEGHAVENAIMLKTLVQNF